MYFSLYTLTDNDGIIIIYNHVFLQVDGKWSALLRSRRHFTMPMLGKL